MTPAEAALWKILQRSKLDGRKFRRQHSVGNYILDFYCPAERLAIELDGQGHLEYDQILYDVERKIFLDQYGIKVIRFANFLIFDETEYVLERIRSYFGWWEESTTPSAKRRHPS